jgi:hypothetical protein
MFKVQTGFTDITKADVMYVHADSNVFLSFDFANDSGVGIDATFKADGSAEIDGHGPSLANKPTIDVDVIQQGGSGKMTIDYLKGTNQHDMITNESDIGITVDLGGSDGMADVFTGSDASTGGSANDVLDARMVTDLKFANAPNTAMTMSSEYINIQDVGAASDGSLDGGKVNADVLNVDYIMVTDSGNDVDLYQDMKHLMNTKMLPLVGTGATDSYGLGYDVATSAEVETFAGSPDNRVYYEGRHTDFVDTGDEIKGTEGQFDLVSANKTNGSNWEKEVSDQYGLGQEPGFYIEVSGRKVAVTFDSEKGEWKVDSSAVKVATNATITDGFTTELQKAQFAQSVIDRYELNDVAASATGGSATAVAGTPTGGSPTGGTGTGTGIGTIT